MAYLRTFALLGLVLLLSSVACSQTESCTLIESWVQVHQNEFEASRNELVGQFRLLRGELPVTKTFRHDESGLDISVGVRVSKDTVKYELARIRVALLVGSKVDRVFDAVRDASEAVSVYDNHWRFLSVNRSIERNDRIYTFTFSCERTPRNRSH